MRIFLSLLTACIISVAASVHAQTVNLWPGPAPGSEHWTQTEQRADNTPIGTVLINVVTPTITAFLPDKANATGTGIIVAPGGACVALAIDLEANGVARWLQERGVAAFVLKYRTQEKKGDGIPKDLNMDVACQWGIADGIQALKLVRQHANEWNLSPDRIGFLGFSAGAMLASAAVVQSEASLRPNFAALLYGAPFNTMPAIPKNLPPIFMAWAQDDEQAAAPASKFYDALQVAGTKPEAHIYATGHHGFGMKKQGTTSDHWIEEFDWWLKAKGLAK